MDADHATGKREPGGWRLLAQCLLGFWLLHLAYRTTDAVLRGATDDLKDPALHLALACGVILCVLFCMVLARLSRRGLGWGLAAAALLSVPFSLGYAALEVVAFYALSPMVNGGGSRRVMADGTVITTTAAGEVTYRRPGQRAATVKLPPMKQRLRAQAPQMVVSNATGWYFFYFGLGSFFVAMGSAARLRRAERRAAEFERLAQASQLQALRYQVNPHLLFNTLNSLSALILAGRTERAEAMVLALADFFRTSLAVDSMADVTLRDEIALQRLYLAIEAERFPNRLRVVEDVPAPMLDMAVPALILQPLVENAIKHGVGTSKGLVTIRIAARPIAEERVEVIVEDDAPASDGPAAVGTGIGLRNVRERLAARFGTRAVADHGVKPDGGFRVTLTIPAHAS